MKSLYKPSDLFDYLSKNKIKPKRTLSQNFLIDKNILDKALNTSNISKDDVVLEIGPGLGVLTFEIIKKAKKVIAVELDDTFAKNLKDQNLNNLEIFNQNFLKFDLDILKKENKRIKVISSIPYHLTSPIITKLLTSPFLFSSIVLIVQKEIAEKILSKKGDKQYGYFSLFVNFYAKARIVSNISKSCFFPKPKVDSTILELKIKDTFFNNSKTHLDAQKFLSFVKLLFSQRRKKIISLIKSSYSKVELAKILKNLNIDENIRAQDLSLDDFLALYKKIFCFL